ncbi:MAG: CAP domain-containing protein [Solirubrobacteraceae bacterium MAG38_C4-C5]|nr:CAP domain-containing protein [Candidatus Siliceabacter maunaloa]
MPTKLLLTLLLATIVLLVPAVAPPVHGDGEAQASTGCRYADTMPRSSTTLRRAQGATLCLVNRERRARGLRGLTRSGTLDAASRQYARTMVSKRFFAHVTPGGGTLLQRIRAQSSYLDRARSYFVGENLAWGAGSRATPRETMASWMNSPTHRANILNSRFRHLGVGLSTGAPRPTSSRAATYVTHFGQRTLR